VPLLNLQQRAAYDSIMAAVAASCVDPPAARMLEGRHNVFFLDGLGGAGKTFTYNTVLSSVRADNKVAIAVASSGIAALLLEGGRTAHSRFKIPVKELSADSTCFVDRCAQLPPPPPSSAAAAHLTPAARCAAGLARSPSSSKAPPSSFGTRRP